MRSGALRALFTIASFVPMLAVVSLAVWLVNAMGSPLAASRGEIERAAIVVLGGATATAFVQIALGVIVALHTTKRPDLTTGQRMGWTLACLFVGSFALPLFAFLVLPGVKALPPR
jgi:hypothetical protein